MIHPAPDGAPPTEGAGDGTTAHARQPVPWDMTRAGDRHAASPGAVPQRGRRACMGLKRILQDTRFDDQRSPPNTYEARRAGRGVAPGDASLGRRAGAGECRQRARPHLCAKSQLLRINSRARFPRGERCANHGHVATMMRARMICTNIHPRDRATGRIYAQRAGFCA